MKQLQVCLITSGKSYFSLCHLTHFHIPLAQKLIWYQGTPLLQVHTDGRKSPTGLERLNQMQNLKREEILRGDQDNQRHEPLLYKK